MQDKQITKKKIKEKVYILVKIGWEYNDEYYYRPESEGGRPVLAFRDFGKASAECNRRNTKASKASSGYFITEDKSPCLEYEVTECNIEEESCALSPASIWTRGNYFDVWSRRNLSSRDTMGPSIK